MKSRFELFLDTDVFLNHLNKNSVTGSSLLLKCLAVFDSCYTSVINASEIFAGCSTKKMLENAKHSFYGVGVLGIPYKYSSTIGEVMKTVKKKNLNNNLRDALIITMCAETKLPIFTSNEIRYKELSKIFKVKLISKEIIIKCNTSEMIFKKAKIL